MKLNKNPIIPNIPAGSTPEMMNWMRGMQEIIKNSIRDTSSDLSSLTTNYKNYIINGNMEIAQRGTSFVSPPTAAYTLDRFTYYQSLGTGTVTVTQDTDVPDLLSKHSLKVDCTTAEAAIAAGEYATLRYCVEGYDYFPIHGKTVTLSFWVMAVKTGIYCVSFINSAADRSYVVEYTINTASTWEKKTITLTLDSSGTWLFTNGIGLRIYFTLAAGSTLHTTANTWTAGNYIATANQVNGLDSTDNNFWLAQVQLNEGSEALPFQSELHEVTFAKCQRYFEKSYISTIAPATVDYPGSVYTVAFSTYQLYDSSIFFATEKREMPTIVWYSPVTGASQRWRDETGAGDIDPLNNGLYVGTRRFVAYSNNALTAGRQYTFHWTANAEF